MLEEVGAICKLVGRSKSQMLDPQINKDKFVGLSATAETPNGTTAAVGSSGVINN